MELSEGGSIGQLIADLHISSHDLLDREHWREDTIAKLSPGDLPFLCVTINYFG